MQQGPAARGRVAPLGGGVATEWGCQGDALATTHLALYHPSTPLSRVRNRPLKALNEIPFLTQALFGEVGREGHQPSTRGDRAHALGGVCASRFETGEPPHALFGGRDRRIRYDQGIIRPSITIPSNHD